MATGSPPHTTPLKNNRVLNQNPDNLDFQRHNFFLRKGVIGTLLIRLIKRKGVAFTADWASPKKLRFKKLFGPNQLWDLATAWKNWKMTQNTRKYPLALKNTLRYTEIRTKWGYRIFQNLIGRIFFLQLIQTFNFSVSEFFGSPVSCESDVNHFLFKTNRSRPSFKLPPNLGHENKALQT